MDKILIIVESPTKAHKIQEFLGDDYIVKACFGHIADLAKGGKFGLGIDIKNNFKPKYILLQDKIQVLDEFLRISKNVKEILLFSDGDREGNAISWHLQQRLLDTGKPIRRGIFNEVKKDKILKAIKQAGDIDMNSVHAQESRRILDRLVGFMVSPFLLNFFGPNLSAGRVQSVVTKMIVDRENDINSFIPEDFWTLQVNLSKNNEPFSAKYSQKIIDVNTANIVKNKLNDDFIVSEVLAEEEKKYPQPPLVTSSLQRLMSKSHGLSADRTMRAAQSLYELGYCTYIRTDSVRVGDEALQDLRSYIQNNKYELITKPYVYKNKDAAQDAHECIRPSDLSIDPKTQKEIIDSDEKLVYKAIWECFIASQMAPAIYNTLKVTAHTSKDKTVEVKTSGKALKSLGFMDILGISDDSKIEIPNLTSGDVLKLSGKAPIKLEKKQTQPPPRFSEDKLIKELVSKNIGRPATFADLLSKIATRQYVEKRGSVFHATDLGKKITAILDDFFSFMNYDFTAKMEKQLDQIEAGKLDHIDMLKNFFPTFKKELCAAYIKHGGSICPSCQSPMVTRIPKNGTKFVSCSNFPYCRTTNSSINLSPPLL